MRPDASSPLALTSLDLGAVLTSDTDVVEALRRQARLLDTIRPGSGSADLQPVRDLVAGAQVVGLGEGSHGASEHFVLKHRLIELLVEQEGFRHVAIEASEAACEAIDSSVVDGDGDLAAALSGQGYTAWDTEEVGALLRWLRRYNAGRDRGDRVRFHGLDHGFNATARGEPPLAPCPDRAPGPVPRPPPRWARPGTDRVAPSGTGRAPGALGGGASAVRGRPRRGPVRRHRVHRSHLAQPLQSRRTGEGGAARGLLGAHN